MQAALARHLRRCPAHGIINGNVPLLVIDDLDLAPSIVIAICISTTGDYIYNRQI
jgi:hypothetical protein